MTGKQHRFIKAVIGLLIIAVTYPAPAREQLTFASCFVSWVEGASNRLWTTSVKHTTWISRSSMPQAGKLCGKKYSS